MKTEFHRTYTGAPWEEEVGYCRALRAGDRIWITGTAPVGEDGSVVAPGDGYRQARRCLEIIRGSLEELGGSLESVVRTRIFTTDIERWREYGRAHREAFGDHPPTTSMVEVRRLIDPEMMVEIEADALVIS